jgi:CHASE2 domain-containing sensor protein
MEQIDMIAGLLGRTGLQAALTLWIVAWGFIMFFMLKRIVRNRRDIAKVATYGVTLLLWGYGAWTVAHLMAAH